MHVVQFLTAVSGLSELVLRAGPVFEPRASDVGQGLVGVLKETSFAGLLSVIEALALRPDANRRVEHEGSELFDETKLKTLEEVLLTLNNIARLDMLLVQRFAAENQVMETFFISRGEAGGEEEIEIMFMEREIRVCQHTSIASINNRIN
jgi:hypothetical protein